MKYIKPFMWQEKSITQIKHTTRIKIVAEFVDSSNRINKCSSADDVCSDAYVCACMRSTYSNEISTSMQIRSSTFSSTQSIKIAAESINSTQQIKIFSCKYLPPHMKVSSSTPTNSFMDQVNTKTQINHSSKMKIAEFVDSSHQIKTFNSKYLPPHMEVRSWQIIRYPQVPISILLDIATLLLFKSRNLIKNILWNKNLNFYLSLLQPVLNLGKPLN